MRRRVVVISNRDIRSHDGGGAPLYVHEIMRRLADSFDITIVSRRSPGMQGSEIVDGVKILRLASGPMARLTGPIYFLTKLAQKSDLVVDNQDIGIPWFTPIFTNCPKLVIAYQSVKEIFFTQFPRPLAALAQRLEHQAYRPYKHVPFVTISESTKNDLIDFGVPPKNIRIIPPGLDENFFASVSEINQPRPSPLIVCVSRLVPYKGVHLLIETMPRVVSAVPDARLVIAGGGYALESLQKRAMSLGLSGSVEFMQRTPHSWQKEKMHLLSRARVLVAPSVREGFGMVVLEANARGTPAIGWNVAGVKDSIIAEETGLLASPFVLQSMSEAITRILLDEPLRKKLGERAWTWARSHSWDKASQDFGSLMSQIIKK